MSLAWGLLMTLVWAGEPAADDVAAPEPTEITANAPSEAPDGAREPNPDKTITVYAQRRVQAAKEALIEAAQAQGYTQLIHKGNRVILRHPQVWKGEFEVYDDGFVTFQRQPVLFKPPVKAENPRPVDYLWCVLVPFCIRAGGQTLSKRRFINIERKAFDGVHEEVAELHERLTEWGVALKVNALASKLEALWEQGTPIDEDAPAIETWQARKQALFAYWDSRTDTPAGDEVRGVVERFIRGVVQYSEHPFSEGEIAQLNARRRVKMAFLAQEPAP